MTPQPTSKTPLTDAEQVRIIKIYESETAKFEAALVHARTLETSLADANEKLEVARQEVSEAKDECVRNGMAIAHLVDERDSALSKIGELERELEGIRLNHEQLNDALVSARAQLGKDELPFVCDSIAKIQQEHTSLQKQLEAAKQQADSFSNLVCNIQDTCRVRGFMQRPVDEAVIAIAQDRDSALSKSDSLENKIVGLEQELEQSVQNITDLQHLNNEKRAMIGNLEQERTSLQKQLEEALNLSATWKFQFAGVKGQRDQLRTQNSKLREALLKYSAHDENCTIAVPEHKCSCGLNEALNQKDNE